MRNSKTHALPENESATSAENIVAFHLLEDVNMHSRSAPLMRGEFRNSPMRLSDVPVRAWRMFRYRLREARLHRAPRRVLLNLKAAGVVPVDLFSESIAGPLRSDKTKCSSLDSPACSRKRKIVRLSNGQFLCPHPTASAASMQASAKATSISAKFILTRKLLPRIME